MRTRFHLAWAALAACGLAACQATPTAAPSSLGFRLIVDNGVSTLAGQVLVPAGVVSQTASLYKVQAAPDLVAKPVAKAVVELVDEKGQPKPGVSGVATDADGWFNLRGARIGDAAFVRATFQGVDGKPHYEYSFVRPVAETECIKVGIATTLVAESIARKGNLYPVYDPAKLDAVYQQVEATLPSKLAELVTGAAPAPADGQDPAAIQEALAGATGLAAPSDLIGAHPTFDTFFDRVLGPVQGQIDGATDTFLQVSFTIQSLGTNAAVPSDLEAAQHLVVGNAQVLCQTPTDDWKAVTFWLNNQPVGSGKQDGQFWSTRFDSRTFKDGAYVLTAMAEPKTAGPPVRVKAFLYVLNTQPTDRQGCSK